MTFGKQIVNHALCRLVELRVESNLIDPHIKHAGSVLYLPCNLIKTTRLSEQTWDFRDLHGPPTVAARADGRNVDRLSVTHFIFLSM